MPLQDLTSPPPAPQRNDDPETFIERADDMVAWFATFVGEMQTLTAQLETAAALINAAPAYSDPGLVALTGNTPAADKAPYYTSSSGSALMTVTSAGRALLDDTTAAAQRTTLGVYSTAEVDTAVGAALPSGTVIAVAMSSAPTGFLKCNGAAVSRTTYAALFAAIGTTFGVGNGTTTFNVPELRGEFVRGLDDSRGIDAARALGSAQSDQNKAHTHTATTSSNGAHTHDITVRVNDGSGPYVADSDGGGGSNTAPTESAGAHTHTLTTDSDGGTEARPRNVALLYCIKA